ncbi:DNA repair protein RecO [Paracoccus contaminans]|uniref:DNA repair protein RecO n=1 Tax=Paracoccus contaminans TaxID=1945662 RepID=A0A1W6CXU0_9RHOB|nr:DNA repair protein RecO [Paracoccus contaminans]ARJ69697.1 DNA repair protein RecO [Paracoccus contaminans]
MEWAGEASVIARRRHGEHAVILTVLTRDAGLIRGIVPGGASPRRAAMSQPGSRLAVRWRARLDDQLGGLTIEPVRARPGLMADGLALAGLNAVTALIAWALPDRDPHPRLSDATEALLDAMDAGAGWADDYLRWELLLLDELGFGLSLDRCAVTGARAGLAYVSPRTGHAVTAEGAGAWAARLIPLPAPLNGPAGGMAEALALSGHFLGRVAESHVGRPVPAARSRLAARLGKRLLHGNIPGSGAGPRSGGPP